MNTASDADRDAIARVVRGINESWRAGRYDDIGRHLAADAVIAPSGSDVRIRGRAPYVQSYRDYDRAATTTEFSAEAPLIDVIGDTAVAVTSFSVVYELQGVTYRERGTDLLVLSRASGEWLVVWRTMHTVT